MHCGRTIAPALLSIFVFAACGAVSAHIFPPGYKAPLSKSSAPSKTCGNGKLEAGEACDDGTKNGPAGACSASCEAQMTYCSVDERGVPTCGSTALGEASVPFVGKDGVARCGANCAAAVYCCNPRSGYACVAESMKANEWSPCFALPYDGRTHPSQEACGNACQGRFYCVQGGGAGDVGCTNEPTYDPLRGVEVYAPYTRAGDESCPAGDEGCLAPKAAKDGWKSLYDCRRLDPTCAAAVRSSSSRKASSVALQPRAESRFT